MQTWFYQRPWNQVDLILLDNTNCTVKTKYLLKKKFHVIQLLSLSRENVWGPIKCSSRTERICWRRINWVIYVFTYRERDNTAKPFSVSRLLRNSWSPDWSSLCDRARYTSTSCRATTRVLRFSVHGFRAVKRPVKIF